MVKSISAKYGPATGVESEIDPVMKARYNMKQKSLASWEDSQYSFDLVRPSFDNRFGLVIYSRRVNTETELGVAEVGRIAERGAPESERHRKKNEAVTTAAGRKSRQKTVR